jgi:hypothetical protein
MRNIVLHNGEWSVEIFTDHITRNGKVIYHPTGGVFRFFVPLSKYKGI